MEWRPEMERDVKVQQPVWHSGMENEIVVNQLDGRRHSLDGDHDKLADDILKIFDDVMNNRDTDNGELGFAERIANRISDMMKTAGITSFAQAAIMMVAERESKTKNKDLWSEIVERLTEEGERKKNQDNILGDFVMDTRAQRRQREQEELEEHRAQMHTMGGVTMSGEEWARLGQAMHNDDKVKAAMLAYLISQGLSPEEAEKRRRLFADATALMGKPKSQWTAADWDTYNRAHHDPLYRRATRSAVAADADNRIIAGNHNAVKSDIDFSNSAGTNGGLSVLDTVHIPLSTENASQLSLARQADGEEIVSKIRPTPAFTMAARGEAPP
ncbi:MAG: hypothetical protein ACK5QX_07205, partial [bacterium]